MVSVIYLVKQYNLTYTRTVTLDCTTGYMLSFITLTNVIFSCRTDDPKTEELAWHRKSSHLCHWHYLSVRVFLSPPSFSVSTYSSGLYDWLIFTYAHVVSKTLTSLILKVIFKKSNVVCVHFYDILIIM